MGNKFEENAIMAFARCENTGMLKRAFDYSCTMCSSRNLLRCRCEDCKIRAMYYATWKFLVTPNMGRQKKD